ncbi:hypothetical protein BDV10DRAFT_142891 [Aspergillus recurvatus]
MLISALPVAIRRSVTCLCPLLAAAARGVISPVGCVPQRSPPHVVTGVNGSPRPKKDLNDRFRSMNCCRYKRCSILMDCVDGFWAQAENNREDASIAVSFYHDGLSSLDKRQGNYVR